MVELEEPDKGRAWVVAIAACIINMILSGLSRMIGILYVAVLDAYGVTRQEATLPFSVRNAIRSLSGPLVGIIGQSFGVQLVTICGGLVAAAGAALCCIAPNITWLAVCWGGIHGLGFAFANTLFQVIVNQYFHKYRATASGIALSGACVGSFVFPVFIEWILDEYGLSGCFLILAGVIMHVLPPSLLLNSPQWVLYPEAYARLKAQQQSNVASLEAVDPTNPEDSIPQEDNRPVLNRELSRTTSLANCPAESVAVISASRENLNKEVKSATADEHSLGLSNIVEGDSDSGVTCTGYRANESPLSGRKEERLNNTNQPIPTISKVVEETANQEAHHPQPARTANKQSIAESLRSMWKLYTNPVYLLMSVCMSTYILIFIPILTVIVDYSKDKGISEAHGKYLINAMSMGDLIGRLGFGWVTDNKLMTVPCFMCLVFTLQGVFIALFPFANGLVSFMALLALYGVSAGSILVLFPVLVLQYVDGNAQSVAMACVGVLSGVLSFAIPPTIGHFRDEVGSYDGMFYMTGVISIVSGVMWLLEPVVVKWHNKKQSRQEQLTSKDINLTQNGKTE